MNARIMRAGIAGGIAGGMVMAAFSMIAMWLAGSGFWTPLNVLAGSAPGWQGQRRSSSHRRGVHMTMAILVGTLIAAAAYPLPTARSLVIAGGMLFAALLWAVMQYGIWRAIDAAAAQAFTGWVFAVAHLLFGMMAASFAAEGIQTLTPRISLPTGSRRGRAGGYPAAAGAPASTPWRPGN